MVTKTDIDCISLSSSYGGNLCLLNCQRVTRRYCGDQDIIVIDFKCGVRLGVTPLHAFSALCYGEIKAVRAVDVKAGYSIWVDVSAFLADGSFTRVRKKERT